LQRRQGNRHRQERTDDTVYSIITQFQQEFRGFAEYYQLAVNRYQLNRLKWVMERSLVSTLAHKLRITVAKVYDRYETTIQTPEGLRKVLQVTVERKEGKKPLVARWGGITLARVTRLAQLGVDVISVGALTHSARAIDFSLEMTPLAA